MPTTAHDVPLEALRCAHIFPAFLLRLSLATLIHRQLYGRVLFLIRHKGAHCCNNYCGVDVMCHIVKFIGLFRVCGHFVPFAVTCTTSLAKCPQNACILVERQVVVFVGSSGGCFRVLRLRFLGRVERLTGERVILYLGHHDIVDPIA